MYAKKFRERARCHLCYRDRATTAPRQTESGKTDRVHAEAPRAAASGACSAFDWQLPGHGDQCARALVQLLAAVSWSSESPSADSARVTPCPLRSATRRRVLYTRSLSAPSAMSDSSFFLVTGSAEYLPFYVTHEATTIFFDYLNKQSD